MKIVSVVFEKLRKLNNFERKMDAHNDVKHLKTKNLWEGKINE